MLAMTNLKLNVIFGLLALCLSFATAVPSPSIESRQLANQTKLCRSAPAVFDEACYETLSITAWLNSWSLPTCNSSDVANCCRPSENWSNCFLRTATGVDLFNCTQFNTGSCAQPPMTLSKQFDNITAPEVWYVVKNIFGMLHSPSTFVWGEAR